MTPTPYGPHPRETKPPSIGSSLALIGIFFGFLLFLSYPVMMTLLLAGVTGSVLGIRRYLKNRDKTKHNHSSSQVSETPNTESTKTSPEITAD